MPAVPREFEVDEITGVIKDPEELKAARAKRDTKERLGRLEDKHDKLDGKLDKLSTDVALISGKLEVMPRLADLLEKQLERRGKLEEAHAADKIDAAKTKRKWIGDAFTKVLAGAGIAAAAVLAAIQARGCS